MASVRTLSQIPSVLSDSLSPSCYLEVSVPTKLKTINSDISVDAFVSRKISKENFSSVMVFDTVNHFQNAYGLRNDIDFGEIHDELSQVVSADKTFVGTKTFEDNPKIVKSKISSFSEDEVSQLSAYSVNYQTLRQFASLNTAPNIGPTFGFITHLCGITDNGNQSSRYLNIFKINEDGTASTLPNYVFNPASQKTVTENDYIFKIPSGSKKSNEWVAPASGIFTCYGWLDEINNPTESNENRWVALMGREDTIGEWTILQVQPFIKNNYVSYVGFTFPVKVGLHLMIQTGFTVGSNSDKYFNSFDSITNHNANAFIGGVYTGLSADNGSGNSLCFEAVDWDKFATREDVSAIHRHETSCDEELWNAISSISSDLSGISGNIEVKDGLTPINAPNLSVQTYSIIRLGTGESIKTGGHAGVWDDNVFQESWIDGVGAIDGNSQYSCFSVDFTLNPRNLFSFKNYYAPPTFTQKRDDRVGYVERAYTIDDLQGGRVYSDGQYFYYCVSKDSNVLIRFGSDIISPGICLAKCWLLCNTEHGTYTNDLETGITAVPILDKVQLALHNGLPNESITIPLKAGSILMFGVFLRQQINPTLPWWLNANQSPVVVEKLYNEPIHTLYYLKEDGYTIGTFNDSIRNRIYSPFYESVNDTKGTRRSTVLLRPDLKDKDYYSEEVDSPKENNHYAFSKMSFGTVAYVYELT